MMHCELLTLTPRIGGSSDQPRASAMVLVRDVEREVHNEDDVVRTVIDFLTLVGYATVRFSVPDPTGIAAYSYTLLHLRSVLPEWISDTAMAAAVEWGLVRATPTLVAAGGGGGGGAPTRPSEAPADEVMGPEYSFDTSGGTKRITQSVYTRAAIKVGGGAGSFTAPDVRRAIGVSRDRVEGCDIVTGDLKWSVAVKGLPVTPEYIDTLVELTGTTNLFPFFNREVEELLFLGASGTYKPGDAWTVTFNFHQGANRTAVEIAPGLTFPEVRAHDYIWCTYSETVVGGFTVQTPIAAYCEQVYERKDFDRLGI